MAAALCSHCFLPIRGVGHSRQVDGEDHRFCCYGCCLAYQVAHGQSEESEAVWLLIRFGVGAFLSMNIMMFSLLLYVGAIDSADPLLLSVIHLLLWGMATPALLILGGPYFAEAWREAWRGRLATSALIALGTGSAYAYSTISLLIGAEHVYFDTLTMVLVLFTLGRYIEAAGRARAVRSLAPMLAAEKQSVCVLEGGVERLCPARDIASGAVVLIRPGERIGVDGVVIDGRSHADTAAMTGESRLIEKVPGSSVLAGTINRNGTLTVRSACAGNATQWARICRLVRQSLRQGNDLQRLADRVGSAFVPIVLLIALGTIWWWSGSAPLDQALLHGLAVLVVACPCALGLAAPLATSLGVGRLARQGCIVRGGDATEALAQIRAIAFDKTGTLTTGATRLVGVFGDGLPADEVLRWTAGVERYSEHPLAAGVVNTVAEQSLVPKVVTDVQAVPGCGIMGRAMGRTVLVGSRDWLHQLGASIAAHLVERARLAEAIGRTVVCLAWDGRVRGLLLFEDTVRPEAGAVVRAVRRLGLPTGLLSGDARGVVDRVADLVGIDLREAELSPEGKQAVLERWRRSFGRVAMVGDGLNDGPVLAAADVGVAIGSATDLAREAADLILPKGGLALLPWVIGLARAVRRTILTNLLWAFGYNFIAIALAATGYLQPIAAAAVMAGSSLVVVLNSLQIEHHGEPGSRPEPIVSPQAQPA